MLLGEGFSTVVKCVHGLWMIAYSWMKKQSNSHLTARFAEDLFEREVR